MRSFLTSSVAVAAVVFSSAVGLAQNGVISIDHVTNSASPSQLLADRIHQVYIRFDFRACTPPGSPPQYWSGANGFEIYSPEGADWGYLKGTYGPLVTALPSSTIRYGQNWYFNGTTWSMTADTGRAPAPGSTGLLTRAGYRLAIADFAGMGGYVGGTDNEIAVILEFTTRHADVGRTICVDTCSDLCTWEWARGADPADRPRWDNGRGTSGPRCWEMFWCSPEPDDQPSSIATSSGCGCCEFRVGDVNGSGEDMPTISDISALVDFLFISYAPLSCLAEADANQSGGWEPTAKDLTISDVETLVYYLFVMGPQKAKLKECL